MAGIDDILGLGILPESEKYRPLQPHKEVVKPQVEVQVQKEIASKLEESRTNLDVFIKPPEVILAAREMVTPDEYAQRRILTLGNFSTLTGPPKAMKTALLTIFAGVIASGSDMGNNLVSTYSETGRDKIVCIDTEQGEFDHVMVMKNILKMGAQKHQLLAYNWRKYTPKDRKEMLAEVMCLYGKQTLWVMLDGIIDLCERGQNDEPEAIELTTKLMQYTADYNTHITTVLHFNKQNMVTGHVGSWVQRKAEVIISARGRSDEFGADITCEMIRGTRKFKPFVIAFDKSSGVPYVEHGMCPDYQEATVSKFKKNDEIPF